MRRMRIIPFHSTLTGKPMATLVMEWFRVDGSVREDMRYQMGMEEYVSLATSIMESIKFHNENPTAKDFGVGNLWPEDILE